jgi:hypothetical protein
MFQGFTVSSKKSSKKSQSKSTKKKASLESMKATDLSESFYVKVENFGIESSEDNNTKQIRILSKVFNSLCKF